MTETFPSLKHIARAVAVAGVLFLPVLGLLTGGCASNSAVPGATPKAVEAQRTAAFWPQYPDEPRIQFLTSFSVSTDVQPAKGKLDQLIYGKEPEQVLPLNKPYGVEMWNGRIYVCDIRNGTVTVLDLRNKQVLVLGKTPNDALLTPTDIAIAPDGMKYVADTGRGLVAVYDAQDRRVNTIGHKDLKPVSLAVRGNELYVCDFVGQRVEVFDRGSGQVLRAIGEPGSEAGQFIRPLGIAVDAQGFVYVMDVMKCQLQKFDPKGELVGNWGTISANAGGLVRPKHIDIDRDGTLYVVDAAFQNVQLFDQRGQVLTFFGTAGAHPGSMYLPAGICVHEGDLDLFANQIHPAFQAERLVLVTNQFGGNKVAVYAMGRLKPGKSVQDVSASKGMVPSGVSDGKSAPATNIPGPLPAEPTGGGDAVAAPATK
jgi:hypothetical protein